MENIHISLADVTETASRIRQLSNAMYEDLTAMKKDMNLLSGSWISDGSEEIRNRFNMLSARFEDQKDVIDGYSEYLSYIVTVYDSLESTITENASDIRV